MLARMQVSTETVLSFLMNCTISYLLTLERKERLSKKKKKSLEIYQIKFLIITLQSTREFEMYCTLKPKKRVKHSKNKLTKCEIEIGLRLTKFV